MAKRKLSRLIIRSVEGPTIACINKSTRNLGVDFDKLVSVLQKFVDHHFAPVWGTPARIVKARKERVDAWNLCFVDDQNADDAYHDITKHGLPYGQVFVKPSKEIGDEIGTSASHEIAEMLVDPGVNLWAQGPRGEVWAYEVCDAV